MFSRVNSIINKLQKNYIRWAVRDSKYLEKINSNYRKNPLTSLAHLHEKYAKVAVPTLKCNTTNNFQASINARSISTRLRAQRRKYQAHRFWRACASSPERAKCAHSELDASFENQPACVASSSVYFSSGVLKPKAFLGRVLRA